MTLWQGFGGRAPKRIPSPRLAGPAGPQHGIAAGAQSAHGDALVKKADPPAGAAAHKAPLPLEPVAAAAFLAAGARPALLDQFTAVPAGPERDPAAGFGLVYGPARRPFGPVIAAAALRPAAETVQRTGKTVVGHR